jgi:hypothetical protein
MRYQIGVSWVGWEFICHLCKISFTLFNNLSNHRSNSRLVSFYKSETTPLSFTAVRDRLLSGDSYVVDLMFEYSIDVSRTNKVKHFDGEFADAGLEPSGTPTSNTNWSSPNLNLKLLACVHSPAMVITDLGLVAPVGAASGMTSM